jgi:predicted nucleic acid-binding Zn ribbon protein
MRNVTITLDADLAAWARVEAARANKSLSRYLADLLAQQKSRADQDDMAGLTGWLDHPGWPSAEQAPMSRSQRYEAFYDRPGFPGHERCPLRD